MNVLRFVFGREQGELYEYLPTALNEIIGGLTVKATRGLEYLTLDVLYTEEQLAEQIKEVAAEVAIIFMKYQYIKGKINLSPDDGLEYYCLLGALVSVSAAEEIGSLTSVMRHSKLINLAGIAGFRLQSLYADWECLADIFNRLLPTEKQSRLSDLILYFLTLDESNCGAVIVTETPNVLIAEGHMRTAPPLTDSAEANALIYSMYLKPSSVTIRDKTRVSEDFVRVIKTLGE